MAGSPETIAAVVRSELERTLRAELERALRPVNNRLGAIEERMTSMETRMTSMEHRMTSMETRMTSIEGRMTSIEDRRTSIEDRMVAVEDRLTGVAQAQTQQATLERGKISLQEMRVENAMKGPYDELQPLRFSITGRALAEDLELPTAWGQLAVAGNEAVPGWPEMPHWNKTKSKTVLRAYFEKDDPASESEGEETIESSRSRFRRIQLAELLGVSHSRLGSLLAVHVR